MFKWGKAKPQVILKPEVEKTPKLIDVIVRRDGKFVFKYNDGTEETLSPDKDAEISYRLENKLVFFLAISNLVKQHDKEIKELKDSIKIFNIFRTSNAQEFEELKKQLGY